MFKIGDFSKLAQVSVRMLRHYDKLGLLEPNEIDRFTSYRYYTIEQLPRLNRILALKDMGLSLEQVKQLLDENLSPERLRGMLMMKEAELQQEIRENQSRLARVEARLQQIELEDQPLPYEVTLKSAEAMTIASVRQIVPTVAQMDFYCESMFKTLYQRLASRGISPGYPELTLYHLEEYQEIDLDVEVGVPVEAALLQSDLSPEPISICQIAAEDTVAALVYEGAYQGVAGAAQALLTWIGYNGGLVNGPLRELHLSGPAHQDGRLVEPAILELQLPIIKA